MGKTLPTFDPDAPTEEIASRLKEVGGVILRNLTPPELMDEVYTEVLANTTEGQRTSDTEVWPEGNRTVGALAAVSPSYTEKLLLHPKLLEMADAVLLPMEPMAPSAEKPVNHAEKNERYIGSEYHQIAKNADGNRQTISKVTDPEKGPNCHHYNLGAAVMLEVHSGGKHQFLHRENAIYQPYIGYIPEMREFIMSVNWAGTDFSRENGATRLVPGSHRWPEERIADESEVAQAEMPKGSAVLWLSRTLHGAAASTSNEGRTAFFSSYIADWVRQEENQYLTVPPEQASKLSEKAQQFIGYRSRLTLGWVKGRSPSNLLREGKGSPI